jgi:hypothetical protein
MSENKCPHCGLFNPESAQRCDCGYDFEARELRSCDLGRKPDERPRAISQTAIVLCVFILLGFTFYNPEGNPLVFVSLYSPLAAASFALTWYYWRGRNWARWLVLWWSTGFLFNLRLLGSLTPWQEAVTIAGAAFGGWMLYWLNTKQVREYFRSTRGRTKA